MQFNQQLVESKSEQGDEDEDDKNMEIELRDVVNDLDFENQEVLRQADEE